MSVRVMCVGLACVDIVSVCKNYPEEDSDQRQASILKNGRIAPSCDTNIVVVSDFIKKNDISGKR